MLLLEFKPEGSISNPVDSANNSNTDQQIEIIEVTDSITKENVFVEILKDPSKYLNPILSNLTDGILYSDEVDSKGVPLLNKIEIYPNLPENIYIPLEYICGYNNQPIKFLNEYFINKEGKFIINLTSKIRQNSNNRSKDDYERLGITTEENKIKTISLQRTVATTFLLNTKPNIYKRVNHIDHDINNNSLFNLEWVTPARNSDKENGCCNNVSNEKLMEYIAMDERGNELFRVNKNNNIHNGVEYNTLAITSKISNNNGFYKGYYWKRSRKSKKEELLDLLGYSRNIKEYIWYSHPLYPGVSICREGFIKYGGKILGTLDSNNYVNVTIGKGHGIKYRANRLIMEFLAERYLKDNELVDHINTNTLDNSFENLRIVDNKGNNQNKNTLIKKSILIVIADLFGDFLYCGFSKDCSKFMGIGGERYRTDELESVNITNNKFICINPGNLKLLKRKMESVFYVYRDNKLIDASKTLVHISMKYGISVCRLQKSLYKKEILDDRILIRKGKGVVNEIISSGHGNASIYEPNLDNFKEKPNKINYSRYEKYLEAEKEIEYSTNQKPIKEYDLFGNYIKTYKSSTSLSSSNMFLTKCSSGKFLSSKNRLWCYLGNEDKIKRDLEYIFYKIDKKGNFIEASTTGIRSIFKVGNKEDYNYENDKKYQIARKYINTGMLAPDGFYYQQGIDFIEPDLTNIDLIPKRPVLKWKPKDK